MKKTLCDELSPVWKIARRELRDQFRDWRIILPIIGLTVLFPFLMNLTAKAAVNLTTKYGAPLVGERFVPFLLMVVGFFPITVSLVIALDTFVGEKERGTIEPLLSSPLKDWQLFLGKMTAAVGAPLLASYLGIFVYIIGLIVQGVALPDANRLAQTLILTTAQAILMVSGAILVSTQATSVRAANLMASFIIIPIALLIEGESVLIFWGTNQVLWWAVFAVIIMAFLVVRMALAHFQREALLGREIDVLNIRWIFATFWKSFRGTARSILGWYRYEILSTLQEQRTTILTTIILGCASMVLGYVWWGKNGMALLGTSNYESVLEVIRRGINLPSESLSFRFIFLHNLRATVLIGLSGLVSFGVLGFLLYLVNMGTIGIVVAIFVGMGFAPGQLIVSGILPHGLFELPALILTSAAILHVGIRLVTPDPVYTLGETILDNFGKWARIFLGLTIPLLLIAAAIEAWVTPILLSSANN